MEGLIVGVFVVYLVVVASGLFLLRDLYRTGF